LVRCFRLDKPRQLIGAQDDRQSPGLARVGDALDHRGAAEGDAVEETQGANGDVEAGPRNASRGEMDLVRLNILASWLSPGPVI
jgi:hypothetical protein